MSFILPTNEVSRHPGTAQCSRDHHLKHDAGWTVHRLPDGTTRWTTPTGHTYDKPPEQLPLDTTFQQPHRPEPESDASDPDPPPE